VAVEDLGDPDEIVARADVICKEVPRQGVHPLGQAVFSNIFPGDFNGMGRSKTVALISGLAWAKVMA